VNFSINNKLREARVVHEKLIGPQLIDKFLSCGT